VSQPYSVKECLLGYTAEALGEICDHWELASTSKESRIRAIEKILQDPLHVKEAVQGLDPDTVRLLHVAGQRETVSASDLLQVPGLYSLKPMPVTLREAALLGFVLVCPEERAGAFSFSQLNRERTMGEGSPKVFVPKLVSKYLPKRPPLGVTVPVATPPEEVEAGESVDRATTLFLETLRIVEMVSPRVTAGGTIHKSDEARARELARETGLPNDGLSFALMVTQQMGAIEPRQGRLVTTAKAHQWTTKTRAERMKEIFEAYLEAQPLPDVKLFFPQLFSVMEEYLEPGTLRRTYHRHLVAGVLAEQPEGVWHSVEAFAHTIYQVDRNLFFLEERWRAIQANVREATSAWKDHQWQMREKRLLCWMIQNLLHDMGMVELANDHKLFRVTPIGRYALGVGPAPGEMEEAGHDALIVQPDFEIIAFLDRCTPELRHSLDTFCERVRGGDANTYRLTQESVYRGVRSGTGTAEFIQMLEKNSRREIPSNVRDQLASWQRKVESIRVLTGCELVECEDSDEADALAAENGARRIGERYVLMTAGPPEVDARIDYRRATRPCLKQRDGLTVRLPWEKEDLFTPRRLEEMGDVNRDNGDLVLSLSKEKLKRKEDWSMYAAQLEALAEEPLAARYRVALRAWSGDLGTAHSGTATIVRFDAPELCEASMEFPEVQEYIEGRLGLYALVITQGKLAKFKKALRQRGIIVQNDNAIIDEAPPEEWALQWAEEYRAAEQRAESAAADAPEEEDEELEELEGLPSYSPRIVREIIEDAIARRRPLLLEYHSAYSTRPTIRRVDPVTLDASGASPTLSGFCHQHGGPRTFKLSRFGGIRVLEDETF